MTEKRTTEKRIMAVGCALWIAGLAAAILGLNLEGKAGSWLAVGGNIVFLIGLGMTGFVWFRKRKNGQ